MMSDKKVNACDKNIAVHQHGLSSKEVADIYDEWALTYDQELDREGKYYGLVYAADKVKELFPSDTASVRILDVAAGTGLLGEKLYANGFRNMDGLDPSRGMLDVCEEKHIYKRLICDFLTETPTDIPTDAYDCIAICGGMGEGHIPRSALREMIRIVKSGGYICIMMMEHYLHTAQEYSNNKLDNFMDQLEAETLWKKVERTVKPDYSFDKDGFHVCCLACFHKLIPDPDSRLMALNIDSLRPKCRNCSL